MHKVGKGVVLGISCTQKGQLEKYKLVFILFLYRIVVIIILSCSLCIITPIVNHHFTLVPSVACIATLQYLSNYGQKAKYKSFFFNCIFGSNKHKYAYFFSF